MTYRINEHLKNDKSDKGTSGKRTNLKKGKRGRTTLRNKSEHLKNGIYKLTPLNE